MRGSERGVMEQHYTFIFVRDELSPVQRFRLRRSWFQKALVAGGLALLLALGLLVDWVRLRIDAVDVDQLRAETQSQREEVTALSEGVTKLEAQLLRLEEFERKVRVIANLPSTLAQATTSNNPPAADGRGGPEEEETEKPAAAPAPGKQEALDESAANATDSAETLFLAEIQLLREHVGDLLHGAQAREAAYSDLVVGLEGRTALLASTPSIWPAEGWVTSGFGYRMSPFTGRRHFHAGIDIAADFGTPVLAPAAGRVVFNGRKGPLGRAVVVDHGYGIKTTYGHLAKSDVKRGQKVERGEQIGAVGSTGRSTGPHLHYTIAVDGKTVNPIDYVLD